MLVWRISPSNLIFLGGPQVRSAVRYLVSSLLVGVLSVGLAWAGAGLVPVPTPKLPKVTAEAGGGSAHGGKGRKADSLLPVGPPQQGYVLAGASKVSIEPRPEDYDGTWIQDRDQCATLSEAFVTQLPGSAEHLASAGSPWPENPNCLYMGGYGIGPMNPITSWDQEYGLYVRSAVLQGPEVDGVSGALVLTIIDAEGYFWDYGNKCDDCGIKQLSAELGAELGIPAESFVIASTHSHTSPDLHRRLGFRSRLVHGAGRRCDPREHHDRMGRAPSRDPRDRRADRSRPQPRASRYLPERRRTAAHLDARGGTQAQAQAR